MTHDEIIALTLKNSRASQLLSSLLSNGKLGGLVSNLLMDHQNELGGVWNALQPDDPTLALSFSFEEWKKAIASVCIKGQLMDDLDSSLQYLQSGGQKANPQVVAARVTWDALDKIIKTSGYSPENVRKLEAIFREKFDSWPDAVKAKILSRGTLDERFDALKKAVMFETELTTTHTISR